MGPTSAIPLSSETRLGLHYFPDTLHYREADLQVWLPELLDLGASWLVMRSELGRAIPEGFLRGLKQSGIEPLIQFQLSLNGIPDLKELGTLLEVYARWGARFVTLFDRPNDRSTWPVASWAQQDLVERFLDRYLPAANLALQSGLIPVFPALQPGGSYWDTAFLRSTLQAMQRRKQDSLLQNLALSAYAWTGGRSLDWGAGGPERWPSARPYQSPDAGPDQRGFRISDWYEAVTLSVLHRPCPVFLLQAGLPGDPQQQPAEALSMTETYLSIARLMAGEKVIDPLDPVNVLEPVGERVAACCFWLLSDEPGGPYQKQAWFEGKGQRREPAEALRAWRRERKQDGGQKRVAKCPSEVNFRQERAIRHYLLLPNFEWGVSDWYLEIIRPYVKKYRATVGFSIDEAEQAERVTVVGNAQNYPEDLIVRLQNAGCSFEQISGDGTEIATQLAER